MKKILIAICLSAFGAISAHAGDVSKKDAAESKKEFAGLLSKKWVMAFDDPCTKDWREKWALDGLNAKLTNGKDGMDFTAGPEAYNDADHAVLWTKQSFKGDVKIEYEYTRLDEEIRMVNIIYIQATGSGKPGVDKDISKWAVDRKVPSMGTYFNNMNTYHISYAAFKMKNKTPGEDYIRARRYMCRDLKNSLLENEYVRTGLFETGVRHKITIIKRDLDIFMHISNGEKELLCHFKNTKYPAITEGAIGLRHMFTRGARYKDFKVSVLEPVSGSAE